MRDVPLGDMVFLEEAMGDEIRETYYRRNGEATYLRCGVAQGAKDEAAPRYTRLDPDGGYEYPLVPTLPVKPITESVFYRLDSDCDLVQRKRLPGNPRSRCRCWSYHDNFDPDAIEFGDWNDGCDPVVFNDPEAWCYWDSDKTWHDCIGPLGFHPLWIEDFRSMFPDVPPLPPEAFKDHPKRVNPCPRWSGT